MKFNLRKFVKKNKEGLLACAAGGSLLLAVVSSARGGIRAASVIEEYKADSFKIKGKGACGILTEEQEKSELTHRRLVFVRDLAIIFAPTALFTVASGVSIAFGYKVSVAKQAALYGAYMSSEAMLKEWKDKAKEVLGAAKVDKVHEEIVKDKVTKDPPPEEFKRDPEEPHGTLDLLDVNEYPCYDEWTGRYFKSNRTKIENALMKYASKIVRETELPCNYFYDELGLPMSKGGSIYGFSVDDLDHGEIPHSFSTIEDELYGPILIFSFDPVIV